jgi:antitoxin HicB
VVVHQCEQAPGVKGHGRDEEGLACTRWHALSSDLSLLDIVPMPPRSRSGMPSTLPRNASFTVTFSKENCDDQLLSVFPVLAGAGVILGGVIDDGTRAVYSLQPNPVVAVLKCRGTPPSTTVTPTAPHVLPAVIPASTAHLYKIPLMLTLQPEGGYTVTSPALPELITAGEIVEVALAHVQDALAAVVELYEDLGKPLPTTILGDPDRITFEYPVTVA